MRSRWGRWIADRFGLKPIWQNALKRRVPRTPWYFGDGATLLFLLGLQIVTGAFMALTYSPSPENAYESVRHITDVQVMGWLIRSLHYWGAGMMVVVAILHIMRQILVGGYKFPREGTWLIGVGLFFGVLVMAFTGYTLRWDERAVYAIRVVLHMFSRVPWIGEELVLFVQGGARLSALTLTRLYAVHVVLTPLLLLLLAAFHVYLVILKGTTAPAEFDRPVRSTQEQKKIYKQQAESDDEGEHFFPDTWIDSAKLVLPVGLIVLALAIFAGPQELRPQGNLVESAAPREEWWFWWYSALIAVLPRIAPMLVVVFPILLFVAMVLLPFLDRGPFRGFRKRPLAAGFVALTLVVLLYLTNIRYYSDWTGFPNADPPPIPEGESLTGDVARGRLLFAEYGCTSCHAIAGSGAQVGPDLARIAGRRSRDEIRRFVENPPDDVAMPAYAGRIAPEDLERIVEFVHVAQTFQREQKTVPPPDAGE